MASLPSLVLSLSRFSTPCLKASQALVAKGAAASAEDESAEAQERRDGALLRSLVLEPSTRTAGIRLVREALNSLSFEFKGASLLGYWSRADCVAFARLCAKCGVVAALYAASAEALSGSFPLSNEQTYDLFASLSVIHTLMGTMHEADKEAARAGITFLDIPGFCSAYSSALEATDCSLWKCEVNLSLSLRIATGLHVIVKAAYGRNGRGAGHFTPSLEGLYSSPALHSAVILLMRDSLGHEIEQALSRFVHSPGFVCGAAISTLSALLDTCIEASLSTGSFPILRDVSIVLREPYRKERSGEYALWRSNGFLASLVQLVVQLMNMQPEGTRSVLLASSRLANLLLALFVAPSGRGLHGFALALTVYCGQDAQIRAALTASGVLARAFSCAQKHAPLGYAGSIDSVLLTLPQLLDFARDGLSAFPSEPTGLGCSFAVATLATIAKEPSYLSELRTHASLCHALETALLDTASLTRDRSLYRTACGALNFLDIAPPPMTRASRSRASAGQQQRAHLLGAGLARSPLTWTLEDVGAWMAQQPFRALAPEFRAGCVDGPTLLALREEELGDVGLTLAVHRAVFLDAVQQLRLRHGLWAGSSSSGGLGGGGSSSGGGSGSGAGEEGDVSGGGGEALVPRSPRSPRSCDGSSSSAGALHHSQRWSGDVSLGGGSVTQGGAASPTALSSPRAAGGGGEGAAAAARGAVFDVFISYRRSTGSHLARLLAVYLKLAGFSPFLDVEGLAEGAFDSALEEQLRSVKHVVVLLTEGALDRCISDHDNKDFVRKEISTALRLGKNVVPVHCNFTFPTPEVLPADIRDILRQNMVEWHHTCVLVAALTFASALLFLTSACPFSCIPLPPSRSYVDAAVEKVVKFLKGHASQ